MSAELEIHRATEEQRWAAFGNVYDVWGGGLSREAHLQRRMNSVQHNRAEWFVGCLEGKVVSSLGCYRLKFRMHDEIHDGVAIGSVHTLAEYRGQGFAPRLMESVEEHYREWGAAIALLYSDIDPGYYGKLGYKICPAWEGWRPPQAGLPGENPIWQVVPANFAAERGEIEAMYAACHGRFAISIARSADYWSYLLRKGAGDRFLRLVDDAGVRRGYVRIGSNNAEWRIRDWGVADSSEEALERMLRSVIHAAAENGAENVGGWLPDAAGVRKLFDLQRRDAEITMLKSLHPECALAVEVIDAAQYFVEIDHV